MYNHCFYCYILQEPCGWSCDHFKCTRKCWELCNRPRCDKPCTKRLPCQHRCVGLCGEVCPPLCRVCNKEELTEFVLYGYEEDEDARYILPSLLTLRILQIKYNYILNSGLYIWKNASTALKSREWITGWE